MKYILIGICALVVSAVLLGYTTMVLPPTRDGEVISLNLAIVLAEVWVVTGLFFSIIHMVVDLFITKGVKLNNAVRRGIFFGALITGLLWMKANEVFTWILALLLTLVIVITEIIIVEIGK